MKKIFLKGYLQQLLGFFTSFGFNLVIPFVIGLTDYGYFSKVFSLIMLTVSLVNGGLDIYILKKLRTINSCIDLRFFFKIFITRIIFLILVVIILSNSNQFLSFVSSTKISANKVFLNIILLSISGHFINCLISINNLKKALITSVFLFLLYLLIPFALLVTDSNNKQELLLDLLNLVYFIVITIQIVLIKSEKFQYVKSLESNLVYFKTIISYTLIALFDSLRVWGLLIYAATFIDIQQIATLRIILSICNGMVAIMPIPASLLFSLSNDEYLERVYLDRLNYFSLAISFFSGLLITIYSTFYRVEFHYLFNYVFISFTLIYLGGFSKIATILISKSIFKTNLILIFFIIFGIIVLPLLFSFFKDFGLLYFLVIISIFLIIVTKFPYYFLQHDTSKVIILIASFIYASVCSFSHNLVLFAYPLAALFFFVLFIKNISFTSLFKN